MTTDFATIFRTDYETDVGEVKERLPIPFAAAKLGVLFDATGKATCVWHDDQHPSLELWTADDGTQRVTCHPCGFTDDVLGLIRRITGAPFREALDLARKLLTEVPEGYVPPQPVRRTFDPTPVLAAQAHAATVPGLISKLTGFVSWEDDELAAQWDAYLRNVWGWGVSLSGTVFSPHWNAEGVMVGAKIRRGQAKTSVPGSNLTSLYGAWRRRQHPRVLLCEGETDTVYAAAQGLLCDVYGLPSGTGSAVKDEWLALLGGSVHLAFDADYAGHAETSKWTAILTHAHPLPIPDGRDLRTAALDLPALLR
jgi:hypothetical protein